MLWMLDAQGADWRGSVVVAMLISCCSLVVASGEPKVNMYPGTFVNVSIASNLMMTSEFLNGAPTAVCSLNVEHISDSDNPIEPREVAYMKYGEWNNSTKDAPRNLDPNITFSFSTRENNTRVIEWHIDNLTQSEGTLNLSTIMLIYPVGGGTETKSNYTVLHVQPCDINKVSNVTPSSGVRIETDTNGYFGDGGNCSCRESNQVLFDSGGFPSHAKATCGSTAEWTGCEGAQCWSGPVVKEVVQLNSSAKYVDPFNCSYIEGVPPASKIDYKLNDAVFTGGYVLKSSDNGKNLSCRVFSKFTEGTKKIYESQPKTVIVYYPPENSSLSEDSLVMDVNETKILNYSFYAHPRYEEVVRVTVQGSIVNEFSKPFSIKARYNLTSVHHMYQLEVTIMSDKDYQRYRICSSTTNPPGEDCDNATIRNFTALTSSQPDSTTFTATTGSKEYQGIPTFAVALAVAVAALLLLSVLLFILCKRRNKAGNEGSVKEERANELYGSSPNQANTNVTNPDDFKEERANVLYGISPVAANDDVAYAMADPEGSANAGTVKYSVASPGGTETVDFNSSAADNVASCSQSMPVYSQVDRTRRNRGNENDGYTTATDESQVASVTYAAIDKSKKLAKGDDAPEVYAVVNKPRKKG